MPLRAFFWLLDYVMPGTMCLCERWLEIPHLLDLAFLVIFSLDLLCCLSQMWSGKEKLLLGSLGLHLQSEFSAFISSSQISLPTSPLPPLSIWRGFSTWFCIGKVLDLISGSTWLLSTRGKGSVPTIPTILPATITTSRTTNSKDKIVIYAGEQRG